MRRFLAGVIVGLLLGSAGGALAFRPGAAALAVVAGEGELRGWDVVYKERSGRRLYVCSDPWVWEREREIECAGD